MAAKAKSANKTKPTRVSAASFLAKVTPAGRREDAQALAAMMSRLSGEPAVMWGPSIVGFGSCHYRYESGREGDMPRVGFSPRKPALVLYVDANFPGRDALVAKLGKVKTGASCIYLKQLADADPKVLEKMIRQSLAHLKKAYPKAY
jgi:hypothetical protein